MKSATTQDLIFMGRTYRLGSFNQKQNAQWEFVTGNETVDNWTTLLTIIDRPDVRTREELDRLAEGIMANYKSHGGQILLARTMQNDSGPAFNYMTVAFEQPAQHRFELNFVKIALGAKNGMVVVHGMRITDPRNYLAKAKTFLNEHSGEVGQAIGTFELPDVSKWSRETF